MKIKDLDPQTNLYNVKVKTSEGKVGYWKGQWEKGVWLGEGTEGGFIKPVLVDNLKDTLEWEVIEEVNNE